MVLWIRAPSTQYFDTQVSFRIQLIIHKYNFVATADLLERTHIENLELALSALYFTLHVLAHGIDPTKWSSKGT